MHTQMHMYIHITCVSALCVCEYISGCRRAICVCDCELNVCCVCV